jgi:hypothetical protein
LLSRDAENIPGIGDKRLSPSDCLLVVGLPLTQPDFLTSLRDRSTYAHVRSDATTALVGDETVAWARFQKRFVTRCMELLTRIKELGGRDGEQMVMTSPDLDDLSAASERFSVIAFFTHTAWRPFSVADIKERGRDGLVEALLFGSTIAAETFRAWLGSQASGADAGTNPPGSDEIFESLATASRLALEWWADDAGNKKPPDPSAFRRAVIDNLCRPELDRQFGEFINADRGIEYGGVMRPVVDLFEPLVGAAKRARRHFFFDLRMCNAALIYNSVKALDPGNLVATNQWEVYPVFSLKRYHAVLRHLKEHHCSYLEACREVHLSLTRRRKSA